MCAQLAIASIQLLQFIQFVLAIGLQYRGPGQPGQLPLDRHISVHQAGPASYILYVLEDKMTIRRAALVTTTAVETFMQAALHRHGYPNSAGCYARIARHSAVPGRATRQDGRTLAASPNARAPARAGSVV
jgi:hypothetical protein